MTGPGIALLVTEEWFDRIFTKDMLAGLAELGEVTPREAVPATWTEELACEVIEGARAAVTCWGTVTMTERILNAAPDLGLIAHAAGTVRPIVCEEVWRRGIRVTSTAAAIAVGVAETTLGLIITGVKRIDTFNRATHAGGWRAAATQANDPYGIVIGVVGASFVGRHLMKLLANLDVEVLLYDPYVDAEEAGALGVTKVDLARLFSESDVVTLHAPALRSTAGMVTGELLGSMKEGALFINTARGSLVDEGALVAELSKGRIFACLDVTDPEPPADESPLRGLDNVVLTPHIAGHVGNGFRRQGKLACQEIERFLAGKPAIHEVREEDLDRVA